MKIETKSSDTKSQTAALVCLSHAVADLRAISWSLQGTPEYSELSRLTQELRELAQAVESRIYPTGKGYYPIYSTAQQTVEANDGRIA